MEARRAELEKETAAHRAKIADKDLPQLPRLKSRSEMLKEMEARRAEVKKMIVEVLANSGSPKAVDYLMELIDG